MKAIQHHIRGIKCDAEGCDYRDDSAELENYEEYLNKPCPECGANLLTEADMATVKMMIEMAEQVNSLLGDQVPSKDMATVNVDMDGSGGVTLGKIEKTEIH